MKHSSTHYITAITVDYWDTKPVIQRHASCIGKARKSTEKAERDILAKTVSAALNKNTELREYTRSMNFFVPLFANNEAERRQISLKTGYKDIEPSQKINTT